MEEAGGRVTGFQGEPFDVFGDEILAGPAALTGAMMEVLAEGRRPAAEGSRRVSS